APNRQEDRHAICDQGADSLYKKRPGYLVERSDQFKGQAFTGISRRDVLVRAGHQDFAAVGPPAIVKLGHLPPAAEPDAPGPTATPGLPATVAARRRPATVERRPRPSAARLVRSPLKSGHWTELTGKPVAPHPGISGVTSADSWFKDSCQPR